MTKRKPLMFIIRNIQYLLLPHTGRTLVQFPQSFSPQRLVCLCASSQTRPPPTACWVTPTFRPAALMSSQSVVYCWCGVKCLAQEWWCTFTGPLCEQVPSLSVTATPLPQHADQRPLSTGRLLHGFTGKILYPDVTVPVLWQTQITGTGARCITHTHTHTHNLPRLLYTILHTTGCILRCMIYVVHMSHTTASLHYTTHSTLNTAAGSTVNTDKSTVYYTSAILQVCLYSKFTPYSKDTNTLH